MFERFTEGARRVVVLAQDEARTFRLEFIGTEHILLGLLREEEGVAARVLESLGVRLQPARDEVVRITESGDEEVFPGRIPFTLGVKKVFELAWDEAQSRGKYLVGTEHLLLGLVRENGGVGARILLDLDADAETIRNEVVSMLTRTR